MLKSLTSKIQKITQNKPLDINFKQLETFKKNQNRKVYFTEADHQSKDYPKLVEICSLLLKSLISQKFIEKEDIGSIYQFSSTNGKGGSQGLVPHLHVTFVKLAKKDSRTGKFILSKNDYERFEGHEFPHCVSEFNNGAGKASLGQIGLTRIDLIQKNRFNEFNSPFSAFKVYFGAKKAFRGK